MRVTWFFGKEYSGKIGTIINTYSGETMPSICKVDMYGNGEFYVNKDGLYKVIFSQGSPFEVPVGNSSNWSLSEVGNTLASPELLVINKYSDTMLYFELIWLDKNSASTSYELQEKVDDSVFLPIPLNSKGNSIILSRSFDSIYTYRVRAKTKTAKSNWSNLVEVYSCLQAFPYTYVAYSADALGDKFSLEYNSEIHSYVGIRITNEIIENLEVHHFAGLWKRIGEEQPQQWYTYVAYASDAAGADFSLDYDSAVHTFVATKSTSVYIANPTANDFVGLWRAIGTGEEVWDGGIW
jgi:hypothetical protein